MLDSLDQESQPDLTKDEKLYGTLCHLLAFAGYVAPVAGSIVGPLVLWLVKKEESAFVDLHGRESVNFQISILIYTVVSFILTLVVIGFALLLATQILNVVCIIIAAINANDGKVYRYPMCIRFL